MKNAHPVIAQAEVWTIPTYPVPAVEEMPMFAELRGHQGTSGNPYPSRVVQKVDREHRADRDYTVIRLENDYIRVCILPALGGRIFEAYDKINDYHFLYRQHVIKPALIGAFGSWISGGMEFNWPFHHRPSTFMPVDYEIERCADGSAICWLSECDPADRTRGTVGIVLTPDASYFETRMRVSNRTPFAHSFLWWENAAVRVHEKYRLIFPPDVTWAHHHYDRSHTTFPIAEGQYGAERFDKPTDISWHKNTRSANSYFAAPSEFDFFGGYDYEKECGTMHIADHHVSPGKKMFTWGYGANADNWEASLTDSDGPYAELMAGSYTDDQPDFTWLMPYETKCFSQFWYPLRDVRYVTAATLDCAVAVEKNGPDSTVRLNVTRAVENGLLLVFDGVTQVLAESFSLSPCVGLSYSVPLSDKKYTVEVWNGGKMLLHYHEIQPDFIHIPRDNPGIPTPDRLKTAQDNYLTGVHIDQYRDPTWKPDAYYRHALTLDPEHLPSLVAMGEYTLRCGDYDTALSYLDRARAVSDRYNQNPMDGTANYLRGLAYLFKEEFHSAYAAFRKAAWSRNVAAQSYAHAAAIAGRRGMWSDMLRDAQSALDVEMRHPYAGILAAIATYRLDRADDAVDRLRAILQDSPLHHTAHFLLTLYGMESAAEFCARLHSDPAETALDIAEELLEVGMAGETAALFRTIEEELGAERLSAMAYYTLADAYEQLGHNAEADLYRKKARSMPIVRVFPHRLFEIDILRRACEADDGDGVARYLLGCVLYGKGQHEKAAALWEEATRVMPEFYIPYRNLAMAYYSHLERKKDALPYLEKAVSLHPGDDQLLNEISFVMASIGVPGEKRAAYIREHMPADSISDDLHLELAKAYNAAGAYDRAIEVMLSHEFTPGEGGEFVIAETYMFAQFAKGRRSLAAGDTESALASFRAALTIPENLHAGFWNESVTVPYRYFEAEALSRLGRKEEADGVIAAISKLNNSGMWNMGGEFTYYSAMLSRLAGREMEAQSVLRKAISGWEDALAHPVYPHSDVKGGRFFYLCFVDDANVLREANLTYMLGYGMLALGEKEKARNYFRRSLRLNPDNVKCALELDLLE